MEKRLVIRDLEVDNFKSYAGTHIIGPFHKTFTAVIGPNGSGKSNVIDAMLFVFGKTAKKIRLDKLAELIHNSAAHPDVTRAAVTVNFVEIEEVDLHDPDQRVEVPGSQLSIMREVFSNGHSQYYINNERSNQKDVVQLLTKRGVDLEHNRFLILQGEVEQIALMKPKAEKEGEEGLLEYFDDLIGTSKYIDQIADATKLSEQRQEERLAQLDSLRKVQGERQALEGAKDSTISFVTKDNHLQTLLSIMCQLKMAELEEQLREPRKIVAEIDGKIATEEEHIKGIDNSSKVLQQKIKEALKNLASLEKSHESLTTKRQEAEEQLSATKAGADDADKQRKKERDKLKKLQEDIAKLKEALDNGKRDQTIAEQHRSDAVKHVAELEPQYEAATDQLQAELKPLRQRYDSLIREYAPFEARMTEAEQALQTAKTRLVALEQGLAKKNEELAGCTEDVSAKQRRADDLKAAIHECEKSSSDGNDTALTLEAQLQQAVKKKYAVNAAIESIKSELRQGESDDKVSQFLFGQRSLRGYFGTLRQLGKIDDSYDIAAGVAGANVWGFHVVDNKQTADDAIRLLKENNVGRGNFIVLQQIEGEFRGKMDAHFTSPDPNAKRLFDLIKPTDNKFAIAFYFAVRDTLVVQDLTLARKLGLANTPRFRSVTMRGELVEPSGVMTGGGKTAPPGAKLRAAHAPIDKAAVRDQLQTLQKELMDAVAAEKDLQQRLSSSAAATANKRASAQRLHAMNAELQTLLGALAALADRKAALTEQLQQQKRTSSTQKAELEKRVTAAEEQVAKASKQQAATKAQLDALKSQIDGVGGDAYRKLKADLESERTQLSDQEKKLQEIKKVMQKSRVTLERKSQECDETNAKLEQATTAVSDEQKEEVKKMAKLVDDLSKQCNTVKKELQDQVAVRDDLLEEQRTAEESKRAAKKRSDDLKREREQKMEEMGQKLQEVQKFETKIAACEQKIRENVRDFGLSTLQRKSDDGENENGEDRAASENPEGDESAEPNKKRRVEKDNIRHSGDAEVLSKNEDPEPEDTEAAMANYTTRVSCEELGKYNFDHSRYLAKELSEELKRLQSTIDFKAVGTVALEKDNEYRQQKKEYDRVLDDAVKAEKLMEELKQRRKEEFLVSFNLIQTKLKEVYQTLTHGGDAEIELVDIQDPFEGISFIVRPPKKSWKIVSNLSGGEKTLASLSLVFALHHVKPTPVYVMDEIDAALDFRNVSIVARYVLERAVGAQFIIISLRNNMFELAHQLVGICKTGDCTRSVTLDPRAASREIERRVMLLTAKGPAKGATTQDSQHSPKSLEAAASQRASQQSAPVANRASLTTEPARAAQQVKKRGRQQEGGEIEPAS